ncbi:MAG: MFS transporter, partial [Thermotogae bacterium]
MLGTKNKAESAWVMYDWANSAFSTTIQAALLPIFFKDVAAANLEPFLSTSYWGYTQSVAMIIAVVISPILGAIADHAAVRKRTMISFVTTGAFFTAALFTVDRGEFLLCSVLYVVANVAFSAAGVFYDSFLPVVTSKKRIDWISSLGYAYGYVGGGLLFLLNIIMVLKPGFFFLKSPVDGMKLSFVTVGLWWFGFTLPFMKHVREERGTSKLSFSVSVKEGFRRIFETFKEVRKYRELFLM